MKVEHLPADASPVEVTKVLQRDGCAVIDRLVPRADVDRVRDEMAPHVENTKLGPDSFTGGSTRRTGGLIARSPAAREFVMNPTIVESAKSLLADATSIRLHLTQIIAIGPGETPQQIHRDQWAFDFFAFPKGYEAQCNTLWAMTDFTEENGATRVIPGSHLFDDKLEFKLEDTVPAEMEAGSVFVYTGSVYHGGGANQSDDVRCGLNITYARSWLRQEENQYLSVPQSIAKTLDKPLLKMMGYARGAYALGYVDDLRDPIEVLLGGDDGGGLGDLDQANQRLRD
jgi:ectoine hydroxylase-related dioxygenase (phytanoyl-CoA dioxygenase family)